MVIKFKAIALSMLIVGAIGSVFGQNIQLSIGSVTVDPADVSSASCIQVPIFINDPSMNRDLLDITYTVEITGDTGIIAGGITAEMLVGNAFTAGSLAGIQNPGVNLANNNSGTGAPNCANPAFIFNQATEGQGPAIDFFGGAGNANWFINNDQGFVGRKQGFVINLAAQIIGQSVQNTDHLVGVVVIPVVASPGPSQLIITATPNAMVTDANVYTYDDGTRDDDGNRVPVSEAFDLSPGPGIVNIFAPEDCNGATVADNVFRGVEPNRGGPVGINYLDPTAGGVGGDITFSIPHTANVDQITITSDQGFNTTIPATGTLTMLTINTQGDGSPTTASSSETYTITLEIEFPAMSGTFVGGTPCLVTTQWNPMICTVVCDPQPPVFGNPVAIDVTLSNVVYDGGNTRFAVLTSNAPNWPMDIDLDTPTSVAGNTLTYNDVYMIGAAGANDIGDYSTGGTGPGVGNMGNCSHLLVLGAPQNNVNCATDINGGAPVTIGMNADIDLVGNNVVDWDITYNGVTTNVPGGTPTFTITPNGNATMVTITANGFDTMGNPDSDTVICTLDFVDPVCIDTTQSPDSTVTPVDVGTVITLTLVTTGAISATINAVPMTVTMGTPGVTDQVTWEATHVAVADTVVDAIITNPDGTTATCSWIIDINCIDPEIVAVPPVGQSGITVFGTLDCTYDVSITDANGVCTVIQVTITDDDGSGSTGTGTDNVFIMPPDAFCAVSQEGFGCTGAPGIPSSVPTLGEWGMVAFVLLLMAAAVVFMRRRRLV